MSVANNLSKLDGIILDIILLTELLAINHEVHAMCHLGSVTNSVINNSACGLITNCS